MRGGLRDPERQRRAHANSRRVVMAKRELKSRMQGGDLTLAAVMEHPPDVFGNVPLYDLILWQPWSGAKRLAAINRQAIEAGINLCLTLGMAGERTRRWVADNGRLDTRDRRTRVFA